MELARIRSLVAKPLKALVAARRYRRALRRGEPAGGLAHRAVGWPEPDPPLVELRLRADGDHGIDRDQAEPWCRRQTLAELRAVGFDSTGREAWRLDPPGGSPASATAAWFAAPGRLSEVVAAHLESCLLLAAAEAVDAVVLGERVQPPIDPSAEGIDDVHRPELRPWALFRSDAYGWDPASDTVRPVRSGRVAKLVGRRGVAPVTDDRETYRQRRRGPYFADRDLGPTATIDLRDASLLGRKPVTDDRPAVLVTAPFLARGGAEQTLHATLAHLRERFRFSIATLAPHRPELGDRRDDFLEITDRIFSLGDLVHPDAMVGILLALIDAVGAEILYNANGTTLFYDFAPALKAARPGLRIIDHLYDHRIGYIDAYRPGVEDSVDVCVAENRPIADVLVSERGWDPQRVPVIWPCGRPEGALPPEDDLPAIRQRVREELDYRDEDVVILTAARMHEQKRPLDLVALAERVRDLESVHLLVAGGGDLEASVRTAIDHSPGSRIRHLGFRTDVPELIAAADVGCLVSAHEGLPVFMLECLQLGRPFLGTRVGDLGTVLEETGAGIVVDEPGDLDALETAVRELAERDTRARLAARARAAAPRFAVAACADAYGRVYLGDR